MEGRRNSTLTSETPVSKPRFPLPLDFGHIAKQSDRSIEEVPLKDQRAYFYRKDTTGSGSPVYDFVLTAEGSNEESH